MHYSYSLALILSCLFQCMYSADIVSYCYLLSLLHVYVTGEHLNAQRHRKLEIFFQWSLVFIYFLGFLERDGFNSSRVLWGVAEEDKVTLVRVFVSDQSALLSTHCTNWRPSCNNLVQIERVASRCASRDTHKHQPSTAVPELNLTTLYSSLPSRPFPLPPLPIPSSFL